MKQQTKIDAKQMKALRQFALTYPEAEEGIACKGTALECITVKARNKAFLFLGASEIRIKLGESLPEATAFAKASPDCYQVGASGWVKITLDLDQTRPAEMLERWVDESYRLIAPKQLVVMLPGRGSEKAALKKDCPG